MGFAGYLSMSRDFFCLPNRSIFERTLMWGISSRIMAERALRVPAKNLARSEMNCASMMYTAAKGGGHQGVGRS